MLRRVLPLLVPLLVVTACGGSSSSGKPKASAADLLSDLAASASAASYTAVYDFHQASNNQSATVKVWRAQPVLRVDVVIAGTTASLIVGSDATYSCSIAGARRSCLIVAKAGEPLPAPFDIAPASLFTTDLQQLSTSVNDYTVTSAPAASPSGAVPAAKCFNIAPRSGVTEAKLPRGTYCISGSGLLTAATYPSGNTIRLVSAQTSAPAAGQFSPYASPTPLPTTTG